MILIGKKQILSEKAQRDILGIMAEEVENLVIDFLQGKDRLNIKYKFHAPTIKRRMCGGCCNDRY